MGSTRKVGRKPRSIEEGDRSAILEQLLVQGEIVSDDSGKEKRVFPSNTEIAKRLHVTDSWVSKFASQNKCYERREQFRAKIRDKVTEHLIEAEAKRIAFDTEQQLQLCDEILTQYRDVIRARGVGNVTSTDVNNLIRLRRLLQGEADARHESTSSITLETIQTAYSQVMGGSAQASLQLNGYEEGNAKTPQRGAEDNVKPLIAAAASA